MEKRFQLCDQDAAEIRKWVEMSGLENVARIIDQLTAPSGETKAPAADTLLLQWIAHDVREQPAKSLNAVVSEVVKQFGRDRERVIEDESLIHLLTQKFDQDRQRWLSLAELAERPTPQQIWKDGPRYKSKVERRVLARLILAFPRRTGSLAQQLA